MSDPSGADEPRWFRDADQAESVVQFFIANLGAAYISHGELQGGRATSRDTWSVTLTAKIRREVASILEGDAGRSRDLAIVRHGGEIAALAMVSFIADAPTPYAVLDDLVVTTGRRGSGVGAGLLRWIEAECQARGMRRLFLESGVANHRAHDFFERRGFSQTSIVMMKDLA